MKKKKGFTLIELLVTIVIVALIGTIAFVGVQKLLDKSRKQTNTVSLSSIKSSSVNYIEEYADEVSSFWYQDYSGTEGNYVENDNEYSCISIRLLINRGYLKEGINVKTETGNEINDDTLIKVTRNKTTKVINDEVFLDDLSCKEFDNEEMQIDFNISGLLGENDWYIDNLNVEILPKVGKSGVRSIDYYIKNNNTKSTSSTLTTNDNKTVPISDSSSSLKLCATVTNGIGKVSNEFCTKDLKQDKTTPSSTLISSDNINTNMWHKNNFTLSIKDNTVISSLTKYIGKDLTKVEEKDISTKTNSINIDSDINNETYYSKVCNEAGTCSNINSYIVKLDKTPPIISISKSNDTTEYIDNLYLKLKFIDTLSGVTKYKLTTNSTYNDNNWISISNTTLEQNINSEIISSNGEYYLFVQDAVGNYSIASVKIDNLGTPKEVVIDEKSTSSTISNNYIIKDAKKIISVNVDQGNVDYSFSNITLSYTLKNGSSTTETYNTTCERRADYDEEEVCYCDGKKTSSSTCTEEYNHGSGSGEWTFTCGSNNKWSGKNKGTYNVDCGSDKKVWDCDWHCADEHKGSCTKGETDTCSDPCEGYCIRSYSADCKTKRKYYCDRGETLSGKYCEYDCEDEREVYKYKITVKYIV